MTDERPFLTLPAGITREEVNAQYIPVAHDPVENEADHFYVCEHCGQAVDRRKLGDVLYHEQAEHDPLPIE